MQITLDEIITAIRQGAVSVANIQDATGAATGCGRCLPRVKMLLEE